MKSKINLCLMAGVALVSYFVGIAVADIGKVPKVEPYSQWLPLIVFVVFGGIFVIGFLAGWDERKNRED